MNPNDCPAFPSSHTHSDGRAFYEEGMDLRDYFAAKAMQSLLVDQTVSWTPGDLSMFAYKMADAMLEARAK